MALTALILLPLLIWGFHKKGTPAKKLLVFPILAGVFTSLDHGFWSTAIQSTNVANATLLNNISPVWVALFAMFVWGEQLGVRFWIGVVLALAGAATVLGTSLILEPRLVRGDVLALISSVFYSGYFLVAQRGRAYLDTHEFVWSMCLTSALTLLLATRAFGMHLVGYSGLTYLTFLGAALISQIGGYLSITYALGTLPASVVTPTMVAQPVLTAVLAVPLAREPLALGQWIGCFVVAGGIYLVNISRAS
jgi:drug/metabolite transporter (DMT)-like permease